MSAERERASIGWRRMRQAGLLEKQRYSKSAPLLPVKITTPTLTPTRRMDKRTRKSVRVASVESPTSESVMEIVWTDGVRIRLSLDACLHARAPLSRGSRDVTDRFETAPDAFQ
jgi:hypothetical protein